MSDFLPSWESIPHSGWDLTESGLVFTTPNPVVNKNVLLWALYPIDAIIGEDVPVKSLSAAGHMAGQTQVDLCDNSANSEHSSASDASGASTTTSRATSSAATSSELFPVDADDGAGSLDEEKSYWQANWPADDYHPSEDHQLMIELQQTNLSVPAVSSPTPLVTALNLSSKPVEPSSGPQRQKKHKGRGKSTAIMKVGAGSRSGKKSRTDRRFKCDKCNTSFSDRSGLAKHRKTANAHVDPDSEPEWKCDSEGCVKAFRRHDALRRHEITIHGRAV